VVQDCAGPLLFGFVPVQLNASPTFVFVITARLSLCLLLLAPRLLLLLSPQQAKSGPPVPQELLSPMLDEFLQNCFKVRGFLWFHFASFVWSLFANLLIIELHYRFWLLIV
jgi:hypothetical protein